MIMDLKDKLAKRCLISRLLFFFQSSGFPPWCRLMTLSKKLSAIDEQISCDPAYVNKVYASQDTKWFDYIIIWKLRWLGRTNFSSDERGQDMTLMTSILCHTSTREDSRGLLTWLEMPPYSLFSIRLLSKKWLTSHNFSRIFPMCSNATKILSALIVFLIFLRRVRSISLPI